MYCNNQEMNLSEYIAFHTRDMHHLPEWRIREAEALTIFDYLGSVGEFSEEDEHALAELGYTAAEFTEDYN